MTYKFIEVIGDYQVHQEGFMWVVEDTTDRVAFGKSKDEAIKNMDDFILKEKIFNAQHL